MSASNSLRRSRLGPGPAAAFGTRQPLLLLLAPLGDREFREWPERVIDTSRWVTRSLGSSGTTRRRSCTIDASGWMTRTTDAKATTYTRRQGGNGHQRHRELRVITKVFRANAGRA